MNIVHSRLSAAIDALELWIKRLYGSKKGLRNKIIYSLLLRIGLFSSTKKVDFTKIKRLIFICEGNICRSPLGEACARRHLVATESFGLGCSNGHPADPRAVSFAQTMLLDLTNHKTRHIDHYVPQTGDLLICTEPRHLRILQQRLGATIPITLAGLWITPAIAYIHDPYNCCEAYFTLCEERVAAAAGNLVKNIQPKTTDI